MPRLVYMHWFPSMFSSRPACNRLQVHLNVVLLRCFPRISYDVNWHVVLCCVAAEKFLFSREIAGLVGQREYHFGKQVLAIKRLFIFGELSQRSWSPIYFEKNMNKFPWASLHIVKDYPTAAKNSKRCFLCLAEVARC